MSAARGDSRDAFLRGGNGRVEFDDSAIFRERVGPTFLSLMLARDTELRGDHTGALLLLDLAQRLISGAFGRTRRAASNAERAPA